MDVVDRRTFLRRSVIAAAAVGTALDPLRLIGLGCRLDAGLPGTPPRPRPARRHRQALAAARLPVPLVPRHRSGPQLIDGGATVLPGRHDGMAAFPAPDGNVWLVRNHEINNPGAAIGVGTPYDPMAQGITTTVLVTRFGEVLDAFTSLNGTQMNCAGGATPWDTWIMCEETVNGPDVGADFTGVSNVPLTQRHGFIFEVPAGGQSNRRPITSAGRFAHEAAAWNPKESALYLTEDNFGFPSGLYRYFPPTDPMETGSLADGGRLQMLRVVGQPNAHLEGKPDERRHLRCRLGRHRRSQPDLPVHARSAGADVERRRHQLRRQPGSRAGRGRFLAARGRHPFEGNGLLRRHAGRRRGGAGTPTDHAATGTAAARSGRTTRRSRRSTCVFQSPGAAVLDLPDNITTEQPRHDRHLRRRDRRQLRARADTDGELFDIALNRLRSSVTGAPRFGDEFAGATFSPDGDTLFVNIQAARASRSRSGGPGAASGCNDGRNRGA